MDFSTKMNANDTGVFDLLTELCTKTALKYSHHRISQKRLVSKMRSHSYELILRKGSDELPTGSKEPIVDLLSYYFVSQRNVKNVAEYRRSVELKRLINTVRTTDFGEQKEYIYNVLKLLINLSDTVNEDLAPEMYQKPFTFGLLNEMLPRPKREKFGSPQPYPYFPAHVFELPFSLKRKGAALGSEISQTYTEYTVESFDSRSFLPESNMSQGISELKTFRSPMSLASMASTNFSPYPESNLWDIPRLTGPRDLQIPGTQGSQANVVISLPSTTKTDMKEVFRAGSNDQSEDIWELATQIDKDIPEDIWEIVAKLPIVNERQLIASSSRELVLWRQMYDGAMSDLNIISEKQFIRHIMFLIIGVETTSFPFDKERNCFTMRENLVLEGISKEHIRGYVSELLSVGTYYKRLFMFAFNQSLEDHSHTKGLVYEATREVIRRYLLEFRLKATEIYEDCCKNSAESLNCMPTLLEILFYMEPLKYEIESVVAIYKMLNTDKKATIPQGAELMSYLFSEISLVTHQKTAFTLYNSLFSICKVYFKFIERFIFDGELNDKYNEFFIRKDSTYVNCRSKRYWDKGFHITQSVTVPEFLRVVAKFILLCGKSLRLLKLCNPSDPLVQLISTNHPSVKACASFEELERQQQVLDVYRTRCLFVNGELVTFDQILLKKEAEKKAFAEMASVKQAETLEKIVAERKRLAQLIIAEKQHSLRVLEAAMAEAKAAKSRAKQRERMKTKLEQEAEKAAEEVDSKLRDNERNIIMEYYSKLNIEVEKSKLHTEWKIKRLQLDQPRMQLLSTEERNLRREKIELEYQKNEEVMAMSINEDIETTKDEPTPTEEETDEPVNETNTNSQSEFDKNKAKSHTSSDVFSAICNVAKSFFSRSITDKCDNIKQLDAQGNVIMEINSNNEPTTSSKVIGGNLDDVYDNEQYCKTKKEALVNKQKVMAHEFGQIDSENNQLKDNPLINVTSIDQDNNVEWTPFAEAQRNRINVLTADFDIVKTERHLPAEPRTEAQREAITNKQKVLGVKYNLPIDKPDTKEPANVAQEEAIRNKKKVLGSEYGSDESTISTPRRNVAKRSGLTLNLKPYGASSGVTPTLAITPGELFPRLDLETPTTADVPLESQVTGDIFSPRCDNKDLDSAKTKSDDFVTSEGFNFPLVVDDESVDPEVVSDVQTVDSGDNSPSKVLDLAVRDFNEKYSFIDLLDGTYNLDDFDPFGVRDLKRYSSDHFSSKMDLDMAGSCYTHPALIMEEVNKKPYKNIFASHFGKEEEDGAINCDNIATLTACLQRSVMLPLTYQLEVVNNSILTYFLVNLDMYEHLRSLKDYFFLMDGEFCRSICHNLFSKLVKTLNPQDLLNFATLHNILDKALGSSISHVHKFSENLSFTITESPLSFQHSSPDVLQCLSLTYSVRWPLNIILSQEALLRYAKVFQFLIKMRRISWVLGEDFETLKLSVKLSREHSRKLLRSPHYISIQIYRHVMASMIRALDNYIVTTCILVSWTEFENDLRKARTLDDFYECHVVYIKKVLFRCLLNNRSTPVMKLLNDIFTVILKFSRVLKAGEWSQKEPSGHFSHTSFAQLQELFHLFEKLARYLHKVVTKLMECGYQRHLVELLTMVNLNGYYDPDRSKGDHNASVVSVQSAV